MTGDGKNHFTPGANSPRYGGVNASLPDALYNDIDPTRFYAKETAAHRRIVELFIVKKSIKEVAELLEVGRQTVSNVIRQPWARAYMIQQWKQMANGELDRIFKELAPNAVWNLVDLSNEAESEAVRLGANREILDRYLGKPKESMEVTTKDPAKQTDEELKAELNRRFKLTTAQPGGPDANGGAL